MYLEAEDVSQSRILSSEAYLKKALNEHQNPFIRCAKIDNESDLDEFELRLYVDETIEQKCEDLDAAEAFLDEFAEVLTEIAHMHSFMDMEGSFSVTIEDEQIAYDFKSEAGDGMCEFIEK